MDTRLYNQNLSADLKLFQNLVEAKTLNKPFRTPKGPKKFSIDFKKFAEEKKFIPIDQK